jgi:type IV fimbrial biogenesis protein FimT
MPHIPHAFTLIELAVVALILAIAAAIALPAMDGLLAGEQLRQASEVLAEDLASARRAATLRGRAITICPSGDGHRCQPGVGWEAGWVTLDGTRALSVHDALPRRLATRSSMARTGIRFDPSGMAPGGNDTITLCVRKRPEMAVSVVISMAGRIRTEPPGARHIGACATFRENNR